ncbi:hypothetical protein KR009_009570 [Drosophila setifemur]|nr:hypothetical protein KR009_009570 [Drosophila setifemur]
MKSRLLFLLIACGLLWPILVESVVRIQNATCESLNTSYVDFTQCEIKVLKKGVTAFYMVAKLHQLPVNSVEINMCLYKKYSVYRPFLFNQTVDYCSYMQNPQAHPMIYSMHQTIFPYSNMNHSCPYDHDLIIDGFINHENDFKSMPLPNGDYMVKTGVRTYNVLRGILKVFFNKN